MQIIIIFFLSLFNLPSFSDFEHSLSIINFHSHDVEFCTDTIPPVKDNTRVASARDENKLISEYEFYSEKAERLEEQIRIAENREKSYKEQIEIINLNKVNYTLEYIEKIQSEYNTSSALVKTLKEEQRVNTSKLKEIQKKGGDFQTNGEKTVSISELQVSASALPPSKNLVSNKNLQPPAYTCKTYKLSEGIETERELLLNFTDPQLQSYLKGEHYISCYSKLSKHKSGTVYLSLTFQINASSAKRDYGQLSSNSACVIYFLNGETITLKNSKADGGRLDSKSGKTIYEGIYVVDKKQAKTIDSQLISKIRVVWSTGYEDYEVQDLALLSNQMKCL